MVLSSIRSHLWIPTAADFEQVLTLEVSINSYLSRFNQANETAEQIAARSKRQLHEALSQSQCRVTLFGEKAAPKGYSRLQSDGSIARLLRLYVDDTNRGRQIGTSLLEYNEYVALCMDSECVQLDVHQENAGAYKFYLKHGYRIMAIHPNRYHLIKKI